MAKISSVIYMAIPKRWIFFISGSSLWLMAVLMSRYLAFATRVISAMPR